MASIKQKVGRIISRSNRPVNGRLIPLERSSSSVVNVDFEHDLQVATALQTEFTATFNINNVYRDNLIVTSGVTGLGTKTITFDVGISLGTEIYLTV